MSTTVFSAMLGVLGMSISDAAALLGCSEAHAASMSSGRAKLSRQDLRRLRLIYSEISAGRAERFHAGAVMASHALRALRGTDDIPGLVEGRPGRRGEKRKKSDLS